MKKLKLCKFCRKEFSGRGNFCSAYHEYFYHEDRVGANFDSVHELAEGNYHTRLVKGFEINYEN